MPTGARPGRRARAGSAGALAGLRHPAATIAMMARPAIQRAAVVTSVIPTRQQMVSGAGGAVRPPSRKHRWWAVPLAVIGLLPVVVVVVTSFIPAKTFVTKRDCIARDAVAL